MFAYATNFNQAIGNWNVSRVTTLNNMFEEAKSFNQDISNWDVSKVTTMSDMFWRAPFNQDLCAWYNKLQGNPPVGDIFTTSACPVKTAPNFVDKTSFCWACSCNGGGKLLSIVRLACQFYFVSVTTCLANNDEPLYNRYQNPFKDNAVTARKHAM
jgi:surface protein